MYTGPLDTELVESMNDCDPEVCILMVNFVFAVVLYCDFTGAFSSHMSQTVSCVFSSRSCSKSFSKS